MGSNVFSRVKYIFANDVIPTMLRPVSFRSLGLNFFRVPSVAPVASS